MPHIMVAPVMIRVVLCTQHQAVSSIRLLHCTILNHSTPIVVEQ